MTEMRRKGTLAQWPYLVGMVECPNAIDAHQYAKKLLPELDDLLTIVSFASVSRTVCTGWQAIDSRAVTTYFRREITIPDGREDDHFRHGIVQDPDFEPFVAACYQEMSNGSDRTAIRHAIFAAITDGRSYLEERFTTLFSAFEDLLLEFRRASGLEYVLDRDKWRQLRAHLRQAIRTWPGGELSGEQRAQLYAKLDELNRVALRGSFEKFRDQYHSLNLEDLWPMFGDAAGPGLIDIRNYLVHGRSLGSAMMNAVAMAHEHLRITLLRILMTRLGWEVPRSEVGRERIMQSPLITALGETRAALKSMIRGDE